MKRVHTGREIHKYTEIIFARRKSNIPEARRRFNTSSSPPFLNRSASSSSNFFLALRVAQSPRCSVQQSTYVATRCCLSSCSFLCLSALASFSLASDCSASSRTSSCVDKYQSTNQKLRKQLKNGRRRKQQRHVGCRRRSTKESGGGRSKRISRCRGICSRVTCFCSISC